MFRLLGTFLRTLLGWLFGRPFLRPPVGPRKREILIKLQEGLPLTQTTAPDGTRVLTYGVDPLTALNPVLKPTRSLRQTFPKYVALLRTRFGPTAVGPNALVPWSLDLFLRLTLNDPQDDAEAVIAALKQIPEVQFARMVAPTSSQPPAADDYADPVDGHQEYLLRGENGGIDARYAWGIHDGWDTATGTPTGASGTGGEMEVCVLDQGYCDSHENIPKIEDREYGIVSTAKPDQRHGAKVLGILGAPHLDGDGSSGGTIGICRHATFHFSGTKPSTASTGDAFTDIAHALDEALAEIPDGAVLILEAQLDMNEGWSTDDAVFSYEVVEDGVTVRKGRGWVPVEVNVGILAALANAALNRSITVIEAAGNTGGRLGKIWKSSDPTDVVWDPEGPSSGAILVGAGNLLAEWIHDNYGGRVDCQGQGENVWVPSCPAGEASTAGAFTPTGDTTASDNEYNTSFDGTSSATAIIGGLVAALQGAYKAVHGDVLPPGHVRDLLKADALGTPQSGDTSKHIGPRPDLYRILCHLGIAPDLFLREHLEDDGALVPAPSAGASPIFQNRSPDIILRGAELTLGPGDWMTEVPSEAVGAHNVANVRVANRGRGPDDGRVRVWWSHPSSFLHPRWWNPIPGGMRVTMTPPGGTTTVHTQWAVRSGLMGLPHAALIAQVIPQRNLDRRALSLPLGTIPVPVPEQPSLPEDAAGLAALSTPDFLELMRVSNDFAMRSVVWEDGAPGGEVTFRYHLRGLPEADSHCTIKVTTDLPAGTKVKIDPSEHIVSETVPAIDWKPVTGYAGALLPGSAGFFLTADREVEFEIRVGLPAGIGAGTYETVVDQWATKPPLDHVGRFTLVITVA